MLQPQSTALHLRDVQASDLPTFFEYQNDTGAAHMAAFTPEDPADKHVFDAHWERVLNSDSYITKTIVRDEQIVGYIASFEFMSERTVGYWIGREFWGQGLATQALALLLNIETIRPLYARIAHDNIGSRRVLEKSGFTLHGEDSGFAHARGEETQEFIFVLE
jgi:RimJ/RimL family protein N-acetyltransferase